MLSHFIAQALSLYFLVMGIAFIVNRKRFVTVCVDIMNNPSMIVLSGAIALIIGILMVLSHNIWLMGWPVLVTIAGWLAFIKGISLLVFPGYLYGYYSWLFTAKRWLIVGWLLVILAILFGFLGFFTR